MAFLLFYVPFPDEISARQISEQMLAQKLVACANIFPVQSMFHWDAALQSEGEYVALLKTPLYLEARLEKTLLAVHPYQSPAILRWELRSNDAYEKWVHEATLYCDESDFGDLIDVNI